MSAFGETEKFHPRQTPREQSKIKQRNRREHGRELLEQLRRLEPIAAHIVQEQRDFDAEIPNGFYLAFESEPDFDLKTESLERGRQGIELLAVRTEGKRTVATVFIPEGKLAAFERLIQEYLTKNTSKSRPRHEELFANLRSIRRATLQWLWTDDPELLPATDDEIIWWEVWLRAGEQREQLRNLFRTHAEALGLTLSSGEIRFPERTVLAVKGTRAQLLRSMTLLNCIAELRRLKETAEFFHGLPPGEQWQWSTDLLKRVQGPVAKSPTICVIDTGMTHHPLLVPALDAADCHAIDPTWSKNDTFGHGTQMGGLALYGDLVHVLPATSPVVLKHRLESVKILRHNGDNDGQLYGTLTRDAMAQAEYQRPDALRVHCLAISSAADRRGGRPSTWSATLDALASGAEDDEHRLIVVCAGNVPDEDHADYPHVNTATGIHDPAQAWNALTVGAVTYKDFIDPGEYPGYQPLAPVGGLSPYSCSSATWGRTWPIKPDVVFEGGNRARRPSGDTDSVRSLDLLSVHHEPQNRAFDSFWATSAATALASRLAATIWSEYPEFWPETVRGLLVHSARWSEAMLRAFAEKPGRRRDVENLLRHCGFGEPSSPRALWSAGNALTLIAQQDLQPFEAVRSDAGKVQRTRSRDIHLYSLPWPTEELQTLGEQTVEMRVVLSHFVEPNPSERNWTKRYRYESHGLRFAVRKPLETDAQFRSPSVPM